MTKQNQKQISQHNAGLLGRAAGTDIVFVFQSAPASFLSHFPLRIPPPRPGTSPPPHPPRGDPNGSWAVHSRESSLPPPHRPPPPHSQPEAALLPHHMPVLSQASGFWEAPSPRAPLAVGRGSCGHCDPSLIRIRSTGTAKSEGLASSPEITGLFPPEM